MLQHLAVRNLAIVDNVELELGAGMTALTGETGAGKSLIVDALELVVGGRASAALVRAGADSAEVHALFSVSESILSWLREHSLNDDEPICVLRRSVTCDGRSRAFINSRPVPIGQLRELGEQLVDVHGQHAHQALLKTSAQRALIDEFGRHERLLADVATTSESLRELDARIEALSFNNENPASRLEFLLFQIDELKAQSLEPSALIALNAEHKKLANAAEILSALTAIEQQIGGNDGVLEQSGPATRSLESLLRLDDALSEPLQLMRNAAVLLTEAHSSVHRYAEALQADSLRLAELEQILGVIHNLARKHRCPESQLWERLHDLEREATQISDAESLLAEAAIEHDRVLTHYRVQAEKLSKKRKSSGKRLAKAATEILTTLGMAEARIDFSVEYAPAGKPMPAGTDDISLCVSTNTGQAMLPIAKVASGGELSRIALAIQASSIRVQGAGTLVFDEVDSGIGGGVAEIVGRRLRDLGDGRQVLTVTHLPQVAALAHQHVRVSKISDSRASRSEIETLDASEREQEIARMLGGLDVTAKTLAHAREMLNAGEQTS
ncbi:MAG: DNA repair protein RecN (Recombination protein N) [Gammaproteobacteria bacterium]|jgi:DNA repair protein RecN (Recombination protein N)